MPIGPKRVSAETLRELFDYNPDTGVLRRKSGFYVNRVTGTLNKTTGYIQIRIARVHYTAHRIIWCMVTGEWPTLQIDHINGIRHDNSWKNLRHVTQAVNQQNQGRAQSSNKTGLLGVSPCAGNKFIGRIWRDGKRYYLGIFKTAEDAYAAYLDAKRALHDGRRL